VKSSAADSAEARVNDAENRHYVVG